MMGCVLRMDDICITRAYSHFGMCIWSSPLPLLPRTSPFRILRLGFGSLRYHIITQACFSDNISCFISCCVVLGMRAQSQMSFLLPIILFRSTPFFACVSVLLFSLAFNHFSVVMCNLLLGMQYFSSDIFSFYYSLFVVSLRFICTLYL